MFLKFSDIILFEEYTLSQLAKTFNNLKSNENAPQYKNYAPLNKLITELKFDTPTVAENIQTVLNALKTLRQQNFIKTDEEYNAYINAIKFNVIKLYDTLNVGQQVKLENLLKFKKNEVETYKEKIKSITGEESESELIEKLNNIFGIKEKVAVTV